MTHRGRVLVLAHYDDSDANWLANALRAMGRDILLVSPEEIISAQNSVYNVTDEGGQFDIQTASGARITESHFSFVVNRVRVVSGALFRHASEKDRQYLVAEAMAMLMSWISTLQDECLVLNPVQGYSLAGPLFTEAQWKIAAYTAGFQEYEPLTFAATSPLIRLLVINDRVIGHGVSNVSAQKSVLLAKLVNSPLLEVGLSRAGEEFVYANTYPMLQSFGNDLVAHLSILS